MPAAGLMKAFVLLFVLSLTTSSKYKTTGTIDLLFSYLRIVLSLPERCIRVQSPCRIQVPVATISQQP